MKLLTHQLRKQLPPLYAQEGKGDDAIAYIKLFHPLSSWTWYATEGEQQDEDFIFFGLVCGDEKELGYFSLNDLEQTTIHGLRMERDRFFKPTKLSTLKQNYNR